MAANHSSNAGDEARVAARGRRLTREPQLARMRGDARMRHERRARAPALARAGVDEQCPQVVEPSLDVIVTASMRPVAQRLGESRRARLRAGARR